MSKFKIGDKVYYRERIIGATHCSQMIGIIWEVYPNLTLYKVKWFINNISESLHTGMCDGLDLTSYTQIHRDELLTELGI